MNEHESVFHSIYEEQTYLAKGESPSFTAVAAKLYGPEQAKLSVCDWLEESELMNSSRRSDVRHWRAVTTAQ